MYRFLALCIIYLAITADSSDTVRRTTARQYNQMSYSPIGPRLTQFQSYSKTSCAAQCAILVSTCNIAVFDSQRSPQCKLYGELMIASNLVSSINSHVVDFQRNNSNGVLGCVWKAGVTGLSTYNVITLGDLSLTTGVQNSVMACGSLVSNSGTEFAKNNNGSAFPPSTYTVEINQQITSGNDIHVFVGSFGVGTNSSHTITTSDNVTYMLDGRRILMQSGAQGAAVKIDPNLTAKCNQIAVDIDTLSNGLSIYPAVPGNNASIPTNVAGPLIFYVNNVDANGMAVFTVDGNMAFNNQNVQEIQVVLGSNVTTAVQLVIINISGTSVSFSQGNMAGSWLSTAMTGQSHTIWNFYQATTISLSRTWMGALLAPYASINTNNNIYGSVAVQSLTASAEIDGPLIVIPSCA